MQEWLTSSNGFYVLLLILGIVFLAIASRLLAKQREHEWARAARHLGLHYRLNNHGPAIHGTIDRRTVELRVAAESSDSGGGVVVALASVSVPSLPAGMEAEAVPGVIGDLANLTEERCLTGDQEFDQNVNLQGPDHQQLRRYWTEQRREAFLRLVREQNYDRLELEQQQLRAELRTVVSDHRQVEALLERLLKTARELEYSESISA